MTEQPQTTVDPQRVIRRLTEQLAEAQLRAAQYGALADQLLAEREQRQTAEKPPDDTV